MKMPMKLSDVGQLGKLGGNVPRAGEGGASFEETFIGIARLLGFQSVPPGVPFPVNGYKMEVSSIWWAFRLGDRYFQGYPSELMAATEFTRLTETNHHMLEALRVSGCEVPEEISCALRDQRGL